MYRFSSRQVAATIHLTEPALTRARLVATASVVSMLCSSPAWSADARSIALGGSVIANGQGIHGAVDNPAALMAMKRRGETFHFGIGFAAELRDTGDAIDVLTDEANENLIDDIETEIDILSSRPVQCDPIFGSGDDICVDGTQPVADLSSQLLDILDVVDDETLDGQGTLDIGIALTRNTLPMAFNLRFSATGSGTPDITDNDFAYIQEFESLLGDDILTLDEAQASTYLEADALGIPLGVQQPEDVLSSTAQGAVLLRSQLGISLASSFQVGELTLDAGVTPRFSSLTAYNVDARVRDEFDATTPSLQDRFDDSEVTESSFTFDAGLSMALTQFPVRVAAVLRNVIPESISTADGFEFETTPQLIVGAHYQKGRFSVNADMALNEASVDNFDTQKMGVGVEFEMSHFAVRGGISHDASRPADSTALSLGFGLGPVQLGARLTEFKALEAGLQVSYSFK